MIINTFAAKGPKRWVDSVPSGYEKLKTKGML